MTDSNGNAKLLPPYVTFVSLINFVDSLKRGAPSQVDRSLMKTMSGSMQTQMMSALKYLHLIDARGNVQDALTRLLNSEGAVRSQVLHELLTASYPFLFNDFDLSKATSSQFRQKFTEIGATGDSVRKCIAFFLSAAKQAEINVSPYIMETVRQQRQRAPGQRQQGESKPKRQATGGGRQNNQEASAHQPSKEHTQLSWEEKLLSKFPSFDPAWPDEVKKEWFTAFHQMMKIGKVAEMEQDQEESADEEEVE